MTSLYGNFRTRKFGEIWTTAEEFLAEWTQIGLSQELSDDDIKLIFVLLYARYGNSNIASSDENQFKFRVFSTIFQYGPIWRAKLDINKELRDLIGTDTLLQGSKAIYNHAFNPSTAPTTDTTEELDFINDQNVTKYRKSPLEAYGTLMELVGMDYTNVFLNRFQKFFLTIVKPELPLWYVTEVNEDVDND